MKTSVEEVEATRHKMPSTVTIAVLCELFALLLSFSANMVSVWNDGVIARFIAGAIPIALLGGTYLFLSDRVPIVWKGPGWFSWYSTLLAGIGLLGPAAIASFWHQRHLLVETGTPDWLAWILPLTVDGLALRAALTLFRRNRLIAAAANSQALAVTFSRVIPISAVPYSAPAPAAAEPAEQPLDHQPQPAPAAADDVPPANAAQSFADDPASLAEARRLLDENPTISNQKMADALRVTKYRAARYKRDIAREQETAV